MHISYAQRTVAVSFGTRVAGLAVTILLMRWLWLSNAIEHGPILCPFRLLTGHPCPMCGSTRAVAALCAGDLDSALHLNPLGTSLAIVGSVAWLTPAWMAAASQRIKVPTSQPARLVAVLLFIVSFVATWMWNVSRW